MHIIGTGVWSLFVLVAMVLSAVAYRGRFRFSSIATLLVLVGFGTASSIAMGGIEENLTPWAGGFERINRLRLLRVAGCAGRDHAAPLPRPGHP
jgi:hypothetical protein